MVALEVIAGHDALAVTRAVQAAVPDIEKLTPPDEATIVDVVSPVPSGCLLLADIGGTTDDAALVPGIIARHLEAAEITEAQIRLARRADDRYEAAQSFAPAVRAWLVGPQPQGGSGVFPSLEPVLADAGFRWISAKLRPERQLAALFASMEAPVTPDGLRHVLDGRRTGPPGMPEQTISAVVTDFTTVAAGAFFGDFLGTSVALSAAGADWATEEITAEMRAQRDIARSCADAPGLEWAGVSVDYDNSQLLTGEVYRPEYQMIGPAWYQVLSDEQLRQPGGPPPGAVRLPGGRFELTIGEPGQWIPGLPGRAAVEEQARRLLAPRD
jgi:hypothetical protein